MISNRSDVASKLLLFAGLIVLVHSLYIDFGYTVDDAFIFCRYAWMFHHGYGWVFNPGERVNACTSFVMLAWYTALTSIMSVDSAMLTTKVVGSLLAVAVLLQTWYLGRRLFPGYPLIAGLAVAWLGTRAGFAVSMVSGLETPFAVALVNGGLMLAIKHWDEEKSISILPAVICFTLAALTRPEAIAYAPIVLFLWSIKHRPPVESLLVPLITYAGPLIAVYVWQHLYYGGWAPNTYYAKHQDFSGALLSGIRYSEAYGLPFSVVGDTQMSLLGWLVNVVAAAALIFTTPGRGLVCFGLVVWQFFFLCVSGGDWMRDGRFLSPALPLLALSWMSLGAAVIRFVRMNLRSYGPRACGLAAALAAMPFVTATTMQYQPSQDLTEHGGILSAQAVVSGISHARHEPLTVWSDGELTGRRQATTWISQHIPPDVPIVGTEMGIIPLLLPDRHFVDLFGLTDRRIAHLPGPRTSNGATGWVHQIDKAGPLNAYLASTNPGCVLMWMKPSHPKSFLIGQRNFILVETIEVADSSDCDANHEMGIWMPSTSQMSQTLSRRSRTQDAVVDMPAKQRDRGIIGRA